MLSSLTPEWSASRESSSRAAEFLAVRSCIRNLGICRARNVLNRLPCAPVEIQSVFPLGGSMLVASIFFQQTIGFWFRSHGFISWLLLGLVAGWLAGKIARGRGFGCIADIVLGLIGSYIGGWVFVKLGIFCEWVFVSV